MQNAPLVTYVSLGLAILGIVLTIYYARRALERKDPRLYASYFDQLAMSTGIPEDVQITYQGRRVKRVARSYIWIWNAGRKVIKREDVPDEQPIVVHLSDSDAVEILHLAVRKSSRIGVNFSATKVGDAGFRIDFDFLDHADGALIEIQHTASPLVRIDTSGVVLGAVAGIRKMQPFSSSIAVFPGATLINRIRYPRRDRIIRFGALLFWLVVVAGTGTFLWYRHWLSPFTVMWLLIVIAWAVYGNIRALTRPLYAVPRSLAVDAPSNPGALSTRTGLRF